MRSSDTGGGGGGASGPTTLDDDATLLSKLKTFVEEQGGEWEGDALADAAAIAAADMLVLLVNTPTKTKGVGARQASDLRWIGAALR